MNTKTLEYFNAVFHSRCFLTENETYKHFIDGGFVLFIEISHKEIVEICVRVGDHGLISYVSNEFFEDIQALDMYIDSLISEIRSRGYNDLYEFYDSEIHRNHNKPSYDFAYQQYLYNGCWYLD